MFDFLSLPRVLSLPLSGESIRYYYMTPDGRIVRVSPSGGC